MAVSLHRHDAGLSWVESGGMARAAHAVADAGRVWLIDPFEDGPALDAAAQLGTLAAVIQLLDRHNRDGATIAQRLGVPLLKLPAATTDSPFEVIKVISHSRWTEIALWWPATRTLIVSEAIGTAPLFALGRRAGVHPLLRPFPPRAALGDYDPERLLVGHGPPLVTGATGSVAEALANARHDIPKLLLSLPTALRGG